MLFDTFGGETGLQVGERDRNGNDVTWFWDTDYDRPTAIRDTQNRTIDLSYNAQGRLQSIADFAGRTVSFTYSGGCSCALSKITNADGNDTLFDYDANGWLNKITDPRGNVTFVVYDTNDRVDSFTRLTSIDPWVGFTHDFAYHPDTTAGGGYTELTDPRSNTTRFDFDVQDRVTKITDPLGHTRDRAWTANSNVDSYNGNDTSAVYDLAWDSDNRLTGITSPAASGTNPETTGYHYPSTGLKYQADSTTDTQNNCTAFSYDTAGNLERSFEGLTPSSGHCAGNISTDPHWQNSYNADGTLNWQQAPGGNCTSTPKVRCTTYTYTYASGAGPMPLTQLAITPPAPLAAETVEFDLEGRTSKLTDGNGTTRYSYDDLDRITQILYNNTTTCSSATTCSTYTYDANGNLTSRTDVTGTTGFTYDKLNRLTKKDLPHADSDCGGQGGLTWTYDSVGNVATACDANGTLTYHYNKVNELAAMSEPGGACTATITKCITFGYDSDDRRTATNYPTSNRVDMTVDYSPGGHLLRIGARPNKLTNPSFEANTTGWTATNNSLARTTATAGAGLAGAQLTATSAADMSLHTATGTSGIPVSAGAPYTATARVAYATTRRNATISVAWYNSAGAHLSTDAATAVQQNERSWTKITRSATAPTGAAFASVKVTIQNPAANEQHHLDEVAFGADADRINDFAYGYGFASGSTPLRRSVTANNGATTKFGYDTQNRLCWVTTGTATGTETCAAPPTGADRYVFDANHNRTSHTIGGVTTNFAYNQANQITSGTPTTPVHDAAGNETTGPNGRTATYNPKGQTASITPSGGTATTMTYADADSTERTAAGNTTYTNTPAGITATRASSQDTYYTRTDTGTLVAQKLPAGAVHYYLYDALGSVANLIDTSGAVQATYTYDAWGNTTNTSGTAAAGNPFRYVSGTTEPGGLIKFGTRYYDPAHGRWTQLDPSGQDAGYVYAGNNAVNNVDPSGRAFLGIDCPFGKNDHGGCIGAEAARNVGCVTRQLLPDKDFDIGTATLIGLGGTIGSTGTAGIAAGGAAAGVPLLITGAGIAGCGAYSAYQECN